MRRTAVVQVVQRLAPSIVAIATEEPPEQNPFHRSFLASFLGNLFEDDGPPEGGTRFLGSGVAVEPRGFILTNEHLVLRGSGLLVVSGGKRLHAEVVGTDPGTDLALLKVDPPSAPPPIPFAASGGLLVGETVIALGSAGGTGPSVTTGVLSALKRSVKAGERTYRDLLQTDAAIGSGNSGGPLLNVRGEMIGVVTAIQAEGRAGFAIPADRARKVLEDLVRYGEVRLAWIGLDVRSVAAETTLEGVALPAGAAVRRVYPGSPAERAGLAAGDVIVRMGGRPVAGREDYDAIVGRLRAGEAIPVSFSRGSAEREAVLTAGIFPRGMSEMWLDDAIGIQASEISRALRLQFPSLPPEGVIVTSVRSRSRGAATGLEEGDVIRQINDLPIRDMEALRAAVPRLAGRPSLLLKVARGRNSWYVTIDLS